MTLSCSGLGPVRRVVVNAISVHSSVHRFTRTQLCVTSKFGTAIRSTLPFSDGKKSKRYHCQGVIFTLNAYYHTSPPPQLSTSPFHNLITIPPHYPYHTIPTTLSHHTIPTTLSPPTHLTSPHNKPFVTCLYWNNG